MSPSKVLVFGPTGNVGFSAAQTAAREGAEVVLAMRDTKKAIPGLTKQDEFLRVQADLLDPSSISRAVKESGAKRAFIYLGHGSKDHMLGSIQALKEGGVEFVVFLSSRDVPKEAADAEQKDLIAFIHAKVELNLRDVFGPENYAAVRPGAFATNLTRDIAGINAGSVSIYRPETREDFISPTDIGIVAGSILASGLKNKTRDVYVFGPQLISTTEAFATVGRVLGHDVKVEGLSAEEGIEQMTTQGVPKPIAVYLEGTTREAAESGKMFREEFYEEGLQNVELYKGRSAEKLDEWVAANRNLFSL